MTLTELIVASVLVGIVTMGLIAAEQNVRMSRQSSSRDNFVTTQIQAMMLTITRDINMLSGDYANSGIYLETGAGNYLIKACFRHADGDINSYIDDKWNCWTFDRGGTDNIYSCENMTDPSFPASCTNVSGYITWSKPRFDKLEITPYISPDSAPIPVVMNSEVQNRRITSILVRLSSRYDMSKPADPITNPDYFLESLLSPVGLSR